MKNNNYTYLVFDPFSRLTKIGQSTDPIKRFETIKTSNPNSELIFITLEFTEKELHEKYIEKKCSLEWFKLDKEDFLYISKGNYKIIPKRMCYKNTKKDILNRKYIDRMNSITITKKLKWRFKNYPHIRVSESKEIFNIKTGRRKKICYNGGSLGVWITSNIFIVKSKINNHLELIPEHEHIYEGNYLCFN